MLKAIAAFSGSAGTSAYAERGDGERDAVGDGEGGDRLHQHPAVADDQQQAEHEQQVIGTEQDVPDALDDVGAHHLPPRLRGGDLDPRLRRARDGLHRPAVQQFDPDQGIGDRELKAPDLDALAGESVRPGVDPPALDEGVGELLDDGRLQVRHAIGQRQHQGQAHTRQHRRAPEHARIGRAPFP